MNDRKKRGLYIAGAYAGLLTVFALLSGVQSVDGEGSLVSNAPNALPWLLVWVAVVVAWKKPKVGGILFLLLAGASLVFFNTYRELVPFVIVTAPLLAFAFLFLKGPGHAGRASAPK